MKIIINAELRDIPQKITPIKGFNDFWVNCLAALGYDPQYTPVADLLRRYHGERPGHWLVMTPVHGQVTHNDAMLIQAGESFHFTEAQSQIWFEEIQQFLAQDLFTFIYHDPVHWLVRLPDNGSIPLPHSPNVQHILHQSLMPYLAALDPTQYWQRLLTELQMFMSAHPFNTAHSITRGEVLSCNGVWFWGGGVLESDKDTAQLANYVIDDPALIEVFKQEKVLTPRMLRALCAESIDPAPKAREVEDGTSQCQPILKQQLARNISQEDVVIVSQADQSLLQELQYRNNRISCDWYWNNTAYHKKRRSLLQRLCTFFEKI